ncbi:MAG: hypothetical protein HY901_14380, partial [Deltaproteobacteria bacterium]|nr:hypothetical protein [Deltaproteobacteria bacterium]
MAARSVVRIDFEVSEAAGSAMAWVAGQEGTCAGQGPYHCEYVVRGDEGDGEQPILVRVTDLAGFLGDEATSSVVIDTTPPSISFTKAPPLVTDQMEGSIEFVADEPATFSCSLDGASSAECSSPFAYSGLAQAEHSFVVTATDDVGNAASAQVTFRIGPATPTTRIDKAPPPATNQAEVEVEFSGDRAARFECRLDDAAYAGCSSPLLLTGYGEGAHQFQVRAVDDAGNVDPQPPQADFLFDLTPPDTTITALADTGERDRSVEFAANETGCTFECALDTGAFADCSSPETLTGLGEGDHTLEVRATDPAGNLESPPSTARWTVDTQGPTTSILSGPSSPWTSPTASIAFSSSETPSTFECSLDSAAFAPCSSPQEVTVTVDGPHRYEVRAKDRYGNQGAAAQHSWTVEAFPPVVTITSRPSSPTGQTSASFSFSANKADATFTCVLDGGAAATCTSPKTYSGLAEGLHSFSVVGYDTQSRPSSPAVASWT